MNDLELKQRLAAKLPEMIFQYTYHDHAHFFFWKETDEEVTAKEWNWVVDEVAKQLPSKIGIASLGYWVNATWKQRAEALAQIGVI